MNVRALAAVTMALGILAPGRPAWADGVYGGSAAAPDGTGAQAVVDRLVREPWRYDGVATGAIALQTDRWRDGPSPVRILIGLHPVSVDIASVPGPRAQQMAGEIVALDAQNRPLAAAPIAGEVGPASGPHATVAACVLRTHLAGDLVLSGTCGPSLLAGEARIETSALARFVVDIGLASPPLTASQYWLAPLR